MPTLNDTYLNALLADATYALARKRGRNYFLN
jgi:hypothetical protein